MKKAEIILYHKKAEQLLTQLEEVKVFHVRRVLNARADVLAALATSFPVPDGQIRHIMISRRRLLTLLPEASSESVSEGTCDVEIVAKPVEVC